LGYTARALTSETAKKVIWEVSTAAYIYYWLTASTTDEIIWKTTINLTNIDYLNYSYLIGSTAGATTLTIYFDTTSKHTANVTGGTSNEHGSIDCTSITGEQIIKVAIKKAAGGSNNYVKDFCLWGMEA